jgi:hypothetical protein
MRFSSAALCSLRFIPPAVRNRSQNVGLTIRESPWFVPKISQQNGAGNATNSRYEASHTDFTSETSAHRVAEHEGLRLQAGFSFYPLENFSPARQSVNGPRTFTQIMTFTHRGAIVFGDVSGHETCSDRHNHQNGNERLAIWPAAWILFTSTNAATLPVV